MAMVRIETRKMAGDALVEILGLVSIGKIKSVN
jgi:hypothetical protein